MVSAVRGLLGALWDQVSLDLNQRGLEQRLDDHLSEMSEMGFVTDILYLPLHPSLPVLVQKLTYLIYSNGTLVLWIQLGSKDKKLQLEIEDGEENEVRIPAPCGVTLGFLCS